MSRDPKDKLLHMETTCGSLLYELQVIWDEVGESEEERDRLLLEVEHECLEIYRRRVNEANRLRAELRRAIADSEAEVAAICSALGEPPLHFRKSDQKSGSSLKQELATIGPQLEELRRRRSERWSRLQEVAEHIQKIRSEIRPGADNTLEMEMDASDLSLRKLEELHTEFGMLQKEKAERLKQVIDHLSTINSLCLVLGLDFKLIAGEVHPSLINSEGVKDFSDGTIEMLAYAIKKLQEVKRQRIHKVQDLVTSMLELWQLMDTPAEEQELFQNVTCNIAASEDEITEPNSLSEDFITQIKNEVSRLEELKASKIRELIMRKKSELEEIRRQTHIVVESDAETEYPVEAVESGVIDASLVLEQIEVQIANAKEEAFGRKDILEKIEKWMAACEEESWLEEYNRDENRYSAGKGTHLILKRAEKARAISNKIPSMLEALVARTTAWESERGTEFTYDGVQLLSMLDEYNILRQEKEQDRRRQRDQRRLQGQLMAEQEVLYGAKSSSLKCQSAKKPLKVSTGTPSTNNSSRRPSLGGVFLQASKPELMQSPKTVPRSARKADDGERVTSTGRAFHTRQLSFNSLHTSDIEVPLPRRPFTPIVPIPSTTLLTDDENQARTETMPQAPVAPPKAMKNPITLVGTVAMVDTVQGCEVEYSFEEKRAGFVLPTEQLEC